MTGTPNRSVVVVTCADCEYGETFDGLRHGREATVAHASETGHDADFEIRQLAAGVERAGADAGVCGRPDCANADSPLVNHNHDSESAQSGPGAGTEELEGDGDRSPE